MALNTVFSWFITKRTHQIDLFMKYPIEVQEELFYYLIEEAGATRFGFDHNFQQIKTIDDFKKNVPIRTYEQFRPYIDKIKEGEEQVTWPSKVKWFAKSSGTTDNQSKYIPVTQDSLDECHYKGGKTYCPFTIISSLPPNYTMARHLSLGDHQRLCMIIKEN